MKKKIVSTLLTATLVISSYTLGFCSPKETANASTPKEISVTECIPLSDINGYFYDTDGYLCFELSDTTKQFNDPKGYSYAKICSRIPHLKSLEQSEIYPMTAKVIKVNRKRNVVTVRQYNGNTWKFRGCEDYTKGDVVSMLMDSNGTENVKDDVILQVRYSGAEW